MAVVADLNEFETAFFDEDVNLRRSCINGVFNQFFQRVRWTLNNFSCSNFIDDLPQSGAKIGTRTFLSSRLMGFIASSWLWARFVPRGE